MSVKVLGFFSGVISLLLAGACGVGKSSSGLPGFPNSPVERPSEQVPKAVPQGSAIGIPVHVTRCDGQISDRTDSLSVIFFQSEGLSFHLDGTSLPTGHKFCQMESVKESTSIECETADDLMKTFPVRLENLQWPRTFKLSWEENGYKRVVDANFSTDRKSMILKLDYGAQGESPKSLHLRGTLFCSEL